MRRVLLTPSQVSVLVTSLVVISCTVALFLSGYVIQQRTLRDLRSAIKPRTPRPRPAPQPQFYLPQQFRKTRTLEDGTIIDVEEGQEESPLVAQEEEVRNVPDKQVVEVEITHPDVGIEPQQLILTEEGNTEKKGSGEASSAQVAMMEALQSQSAQKSWAVDHPDPLANSKVPVSRAERRRLIKDEIHRLSTGNEKVYYQRRLW